MWIQSTVEQSVDEALAIFVERFEFVQDDLRALVSPHPIIADGWGLRPELVAPLTASPRRMVVMVPTEGFRQRQLRQLPRAGAPRPDVSAARFRTASGSPRSTARENAAAAAGTCPRSANNAPRLQAAAACPRPNPGRASSQSIYQPSSAIPSGRARTCRTIHCEKTSPRSRPCRAYIGPRRTLQ